MDQVLTVLFTTGLVFTAIDVRDAWRERYGDRDRWSGLPPVLPFPVGVVACVGLLAVLAALLVESASEPAGLIPWAIDAWNGSPHGGPGRPFWHR